MMRDPRHADIRSRQSAEGHLARTDVELWSIYTALKHTKTGRYPKAGQALWDALTDYDKQRIHATRRGETLPPEEP